MLEKILLLIAGFALTTMGGAFIGTLLQQRAWRHKWETETAEKRIEIAKQIFEEISKLMDQRLFRVHQLAVWLDRDDASRIDTAMENYRAVLFDWNDNINRHLALLQMYFGAKIREHFDFQVGAKFVEVGSNIESAYREFKSGGSNVKKGLSAASGLIQELRSEVYQYNLELLNHIESRINELNPNTGMVGDIKSLFHVRNSGSNEAHSKGGAR